LQTVVPPLQQWSDTPTAAKTPAEKQAATATDGLRTASAPVAGGNGTWDGEEPSTPEPTKTETPAPTTNPKTGVVEDDANPTITVDPTGQGNPEVEGRPRGGT
jgi:hypothetical protein